MALWKLENGKLDLIRFWEFERISGLKKHASSFYSIEDARLFVNEQLGELGLHLKDIIEIWGTPGLTSHNIVPKDPEGICLHSIYHLYASLLMDTDRLRESEILCLALDAGPDNLEEHNAYFKNFYAGAYVSQGNIKLCPISSPACMWSQLANLTGMEEGSLMALGTATKTQLSHKYISDIDFGIKTFADTYRAGVYVRQIVDFVSDLSERNVGDRIKEWDKNFTLQENRISVAVKILQEQSINLVKQEVRNMSAQFNICTSNAILCISGGYGLNCPTNTELMNEFQFKDFLGVPCISDCGMSLGIGLYHFYNKERQIKFVFKNPYYGKYDYNLGDALHKYRKYIKRLTIFNEEMFYRDITEHPIAWFWGNAEIGPRALGHRSIIGDPRDPKTKDILNRIKKRQRWRPVAPIILIEYIQEWFEESYDSKYMLMTYKIKPEKSHKVPSALHIDNTARVQTVGKENLTVYNMLEIFYKKTGVPMLCNTSLNDKGEPIIDTIPQLINFVLRKKIKVAYINGYRVEFANFWMYEEVKPENRSEWYWREIDEDTINPLHLNKDEVEFYAYNAQLHSYDIRNGEDAAEVRKIVKQINELVES